MSGPRRSGGLIFCGHRRVGKTVVAAAVARCLGAAGRRVRVFKPVAVEAVRTRTGWLSPDAEMLAQSIETVMPVHEMNPLALPGPVPPGMRRSPPGADPQALISAAAAAQRGCDVLVVEGFDGLMSPYAPDFFELDFIRILDLVMVWVMPPQLTAAGAALTALELGRRRDLRIGGIVVNGDRLEAGNTETETLLEGLGRTAAAPVLAVVPQDPATRVAEYRLGDELVYSLAQVNWEAVLTTAAAPAL
jgi:dethiobiotin synthetase